MFILLNTRVKSVPVSFAQSWYPVPPHGSKAPPCASGMISGDSGFHSLTYE
ncbi:hypothetical protein M2158_000782 [Streptomyces sp. SAI-144]|nr:hypothetical protein [Streptomyces sp. SAI-144]